MLTYTLRRLALMIPTLIGVMAVVFLVMAYSPGGFGVPQDGQGSLNQGYDAKRIQRLMQRRYGADLPKTVQFIRWINQVSPLGFRMSSQVTFSDEQVAEAEAVLAAQPFAAKDRDLKRAVELTQSIAGYLKLSPLTVAQELSKTLEGLGDEVGLDEAMAWFERMKAGLDEQDAAAIRNKIAERFAQQPARGQREFLTALATESAGRSRVRWDLPAIKKPDFGESIQGVDVSTMIGQRLPITLLLNVITIPVIYLVAIVSGLYAARHKGSWFDVASGVLYIGLWSAPVIWMGAVLLEFFANESNAIGGVFPTNGLHSLEATSAPFFPRVSAEGFEPGYLLDMVWHLVLPVFCLTYTGFAVLSKVMRGAILEVVGGLRSDGPGQRRGRFRCPVAACFPE